MGLWNVRERRQIPQWLTVCFLSFLAGAALASFLAVRFGAALPALWIPAENAGYWKTLLGLCLPVLAAFLCGFTACGVFLLPLLLFWYRCALSLPIAAAVRQYGSDGFLRTFLALAPQTFAGVPLLFLIAVPAALCASSAFSAWIGRAGPPRRSPLAPPLPLLLCAALLLLALTSLYSLARLHT